MHNSVTLERIIESVERYNHSLDNPGLCIACGADHEGCEPDARNYYCDECGEEQVFGAQELLFMEVG